MKSGTVLQEAVSLAYTCRQFIPTKSQWFPERGRARNEGLYRRVLNGWRLPW